MLPCCFCAATIALSLFFECPPPIAGPALTRPPPTCQSCSERRTRSFANHPDFGSLRIFVYCRSVLSLEQAFYTVGAARMRCTNAQMRRRSTMHALHQMLKQEGGEHGECEQYLFLTTASQSSVDMA